MLLQRSFRELSQNCIAYRGGEFMKRMLVDCIHHDRTSVIVDDSSSRISYSSTGWGLGGTPNEFNGTTHGTDAPGASATFRFNGKWIYSNASRNVR